MKITAQHKPKALEICEIGNSILHDKAEEVKNIDDPEIRNLISDMLATCFAHKAVGIAAPQVGKLLRIIIVASRPTPAYPDAPTIEPFVAINPKFNLVGEPSELGWEGCMSVPGIRAQINRWPSIFVSYMTPLGGEHAYALHGFPARIFQHECDHLQGRLFIDDLQMSDLVSDKEYFKRLGVAKMLP